MSKPDFFLPFHLPPILGDTNVLNIYCKPFCYDYPYDEFNKTAMQEIIIPLRLQCGVYQTMTIDNGISYYDTPVKMNAFSISLN